MIIYGRYWLVDTIPYNLKAFPKTGQSTAGFFILPSRLNIKEICPPIIFRTSMGYKNGMQ
jgi:hypothetical protein